MADAPSLHGWAPELPDAGTRAEAIERAFDYRGDVTLVCAGGREITGYLYNRNADVAEPYVQVFDGSGGSHTVAYAAIEAIRFTGADMAAGRSYEAWLDRRRDGTSR
jgi:hypothetical protein